jgi:hypothetical protein
MRVVLPGYRRRNFAEQSLTTETGGEIGPGMGSVFHRGISPVQGVRSRFSTDTGPSTFSNPPDSFGGVGTDNCNDETELRDGLIARLRTAGENIRRGFELEDDGDEHGGRQTFISPGDL